LRIESGKLFESLVGDFAGADLFQDQTMNDDVKLKLAEAILNQSSDLNDSPSTPILKLLGELAEASNFRDLSEAFVAFRKAHPQNARFVGGRVPSLISNALYRNLEIGAGFVELANWRPNWADEIIGNLDSPVRFVALIENLKADLLSRGAQAKRSSR
jgi:hypothetical protein